MSKRAPNGQFKSKTQLAAEKAAQKRARVKSLPFAFMTPERGPNNTASLAVKVMKDYPLYPELTAELKATYITFSDHRYATSSPQIATYLRWLIKENKLPGLSEDFSMMPLNCQFCDFSLLTSGPEDRKVMAQHLYEEHMDDPRFSGVPAADADADETDDGE